MLSRGAAGAERSELALYRVVGTWHPGLLSSAIRRHPNARRPKYISGLSSPASVLRYDQRQMLSFPTQASPVQAGLGVSEPASDGGIST
jgi:hypothetical protein